MLKLCRVTKVKVLFLVLVQVFNFNLFEFSAAILEKGLLVPKVARVFFFFIYLFIFFLTNYRTGRILQLQERRT